MHHQCIIMALSGHHQGLIRASSAHHQCIISASSAHHQCIISASSVHHQHIISASLAHHQHTVSTSSAHHVHIIYTQSFALFTMSSLCFNLLSIHKKRQVTQIKSQENPITEDFSQVQSLTCSYEICAFSVPLFL